MESSSGYQADQAAPNHSEFLAIDQLNNESRHLDSNKEVRGEREVRFKGQCYIESMEQASLHYKQGAGDCSKPRPMKNARSQTLQQA